MSQSIKRTLQTLILILVSSVWLTNFSFGQVFVDHSASGTNDGTSWENAFNDLSQAIKNTSSGEIWVSKGVYFPTLNLDSDIDDDVRQLTFPLKPGVAMYGGFSGSETTKNDRSWEDNITVLDGNVGGSGENDNSISVVTSLDEQLNERTILDGFTIINGNASAGNQNGGAIRVPQGMNGNFTIRNCRITRNKASRGGGGIYLHNADPILENIIFDSNESGQGGDIYLSYSSPLIRVCEFRKSTSNLGGGSIYVGGYSSPIIEGNLFISNESGGEGGAIRLASNYHLTVKGNKFIGNKARYGGSIFVTSPSVFIFNNIFGGNEAREDGGAVYMDYVGGDAKFINNTVVNNVAKRGGGLFLLDARLAVVNSIIFGNSASDGAQVHVREVLTGIIPSFNYNNIEGGQDGIVAAILSNLTLEYENNLDAVPDLSLEEDSLYETLAISNLIDLGTISTDYIQQSWTGSNGEDIIFPDTDLLGNPRVFNNLIDIGAIEVQSPRQYKPVDISLSNNVVSQSSVIGTKVGDLVTEDQDSQNFSYEVISENNCFKVEQGSLIVDCDLTIFEESPINISISSTDSDGWSFTKEFNLELIDIVTGIYDEPSKAFDIFPNPSNGLLNISSSSFVPVSVSIRNLNGLLIATLTVNPGDKVIDLRHLEAGVYLLSIKTTNIDIHRKVIIVHH